MRITVGCARTEISTQRKWDPSRWNIAAGRATGTKEDARTLNAYLDTLQARVYEAQRQLIADQQPITVKNLRLRFEGKRAASKMFIEVFRNHNEKIKQLVDTEFSPGTIERYETALSHTVSFLRWKFKKDDIDIQELNYEFVSELEFWLKSIRKCSHNTSIKYISNIKKIVNLCLKNGWLQRDPFLGYKMSKREVVREVLSQDEINRIAAKAFPTNRLGIIRDIFLFSCYTGLAYADVKKLRRHEIVTGVDGEKWISTQRKKTDTSSKIPLLKPALAILQKYEREPLCISKGVLLPMPSNQKMNAYLKEIADLCGITKKMTFHTARHTFATTITLTNGVPIETVGKMLGHRNLKTTQHYAKILDKKVSDDMMMLRNKLESLSSTTVQ
ncbi:MAG: transposase [Bacteroidota bacterium]|nr:MAG: transposase [Bacteroidota bacterium]